MPDPSLNTVNLADWTARIKAGDQSARDMLARAARARLEDLTQRMLRKYPTVQRWADADDVFQGAVMRLLRSIEALDVADTRSFMNLAATQVRRELIDLARHYAGPMGIGSNHDSMGSNLPDPSAHVPDTAELDRWAAFHAAAESLGLEEREAFGLIYYHGWTQLQVAELFHVDERTIRRRWKSACAAIAAAVGNDLPEK
jgi:RNA polymerase sigma factor (sigma-70 family)